MKVIKSVLALVVIALTGCASQKTITTESLAGKWSIKSAMGTSTEKGESPAYITFEKDGKVHGCATVNLFHGGYTLDKDQITFSQMGMTMKWGQSMDIERAISKALDGSSTIKANGNNLYFLNATNDTIMHIVK